MGLKGVPRIISPDLLKVLAEMGHGDTIVLGDAHFPGESLARKGNAHIIRADGVASIADLVDAILKLIDLDLYTDSPASVMDLTEGDRHKYETPLPAWKSYMETMAKNGVTGVDFKRLERYEFYEQAGQAFAIVMTSDTALYGNLMLTKGVLPSVK